MKVMSSTPKGGLEHQANRAWIKAKLATSKGDHQGKERIGARDRKVEALSNAQLKCFARGKGEAGQIHGADKG